MEHIGDNQIRVSAERLAFLGAARGFVENDGEQMVTMAFGASFDEAAFYGVSLSDAVELRAALDRALTSSPPGLVR